MRGTAKYAIVALGLAAWVGLAAQDATTTQTDGTGSAWLLAVNGPIGPATSDYVVRGLDHAADAGARLVVMSIDTPGGLDTSMREIVKGILAAPMPVACFVHPSGSRAASAGTFILYACHIAAMAPATNLGAATPVSIGGSPPKRPVAPSPAAPEATDGNDTDGEASGESSDDGGPVPGKESASALERKALNDAIAYIRGLAELRGRNAEWAEDAVRNAASLSASAALEAGVIDVVANDIDALLKQLDGRTVTLANGTVTLATAGIALERIEPDWRTRFLATITNPTIAYGLLLIGIYGLMFEGYNPGAMVPGVIGAISLLLALYSLQVLSVNYAGLGLIVLGLLLMAGEMLMPSFGALGMGGIAAFVIGSIILIDTEAPGFGVPRGLIGGMAAVGASLVMAIIWFASRARGRPIVSGAEQMLNSSAVAVTDFESEGRVRVHGELWQARTDTPVVAGQTLRVIALDGLWLTVKPDNGAEER